MKETQIIGDTTATPDYIALSFSCELMSREIVTVEPIYSGFGGGYEILYRSGEEFARVDDVLHLHIRVNLNNSTPEAWIWPHLIRQWYEEDRLCVASMSFTDSAEQGLGSRGFVIPSILGESSIPTRTPQEITSTPPNYVCISEIFQIQQTLKFFRFVLKGTAVSKYVKISNGAIELTSEYKERLFQNISTLTTTN